MSSPEKNDKSSAVTIPILTDVVAQEELAQARARDAVKLSGISEERLAELQTQLAAGVHKLADELLQIVFQEMEVALFEQVSNRLRRELPEIVDRILRDHLGTVDD
ncbi:MAG: hypothetical protein V3S70_10540 [Gammaproteobacteria bacterium]